VLVLNRFMVPPDEADTFGGPAARALAALSRQRGYRSGRLGRAADEPRLWVIVTEWAGAGYWRRALSAFEVRMELTPITVHALDEPGAFELLRSLDGPAEESAEQPAEEPAEKPAQLPDRGPAAEAAWEAADEPARGDRPGFGSLDRRPDRAPDASWAGPGRRGPGATSDPAD
jgi:heme oxygenase (mycobilin-producing)